MDYGFDQVVKHVQLAEVTLFVYESQVFSTMLGRKVTQKQRYVLCLDCEDEVVSGGAMLGKPVSSRPARPDEPCQRCGKRVAA